MSETIQTPVRYDEKQKVIRNELGSVVLELSTVRVFTDAQAAEVDERLDRLGRTVEEALNDHTRLLAENAEYKAEVERLANLVETLKSEAAIHAGESRCANSTIYEIYQLVTGSTGEPGNWNGAEPVRKRLEVDAAEVERLREALQGWMDWYNGPHAEGVSYISPPLKRTEAALKEKA